MALAAHKGSRPGAHQREDCSETKQATGSFTACVSFSALSRFIGCCSISRR